MFVMQHKDFSNTNSRQISALFKKKKLQSSEVELNYNTSLKQTKKLNALGRNNIKDD